MPFSLQKVTALATSPPHTAITPLSLTATRFSENEVSVDKAVDVVLYF